MRNIEPDTLQVVAEQNSVRVIHNVIPQVHCTPMRPVSRLCSNI